MRSGVSMRSGVRCVFWGVVACALLSPGLLQRCGGASRLPELPSVSRGGDVTLGGLFSLHDAVVEARPSFRAPPDPTQCTGFNFRTFRWMQTMIFAIEKINGDASLLPNVTLGYEIYDSCSDPLHALRTATDLVGGAGCRGVVPAVVGDGGSTLSMVVAHLLGVLHLPQVSYFSSCACLSDKKTFPTFLRTMPSDFFQVNALARLVEHFGWTWVGMVAGDDAYGRGGAQLFEELLTRAGACVALREVIPKDHGAAEMSRVVGRVRGAGARVVLVFALEQDARALFAEALRQKLSGIQWLGSEAWITAAALAAPAFHAVLQGAMGFAIRRAEMPVLRPFLLRLNPLVTPGDAIVREFWEEIFGCSLSAPAGGGASSRPPCNGSEDLAHVQSIYSDVSQLRISYNVYKAVYAIAHALDAMLRCVPGRGPFSAGGCANAHSIEPWQLLHYLKRVDFTNEYGERTWFDLNGDAVAMYDLINLQVSAGGVRYASVGTYRDTQSPNLLIQEESIVWNQNHTQVPVSVCSTSCSPGTRRAIRPASPVCCFDCVVCAAGEVSNTTDAVECVACGPESWSNAGRDACVPRLVEFLWHGEPLGAALLALALLGSCTTLAVVLVFARLRHTPLVRANNAELSFLILGSLWLCFLSAAAFVGRPTAWSCRLRHTAFGVAFCLCLSCVLGKTAVVLMAFGATEPGSAAARWTRWVRPRPLRALVSLCTAVQVGICGAWLSLAPPTPRRLMARESARIVLLCDVGSTLGFSLVLGYIGLLAAVCFILAFLARKLPDHFNEAKFITFSMLIFCAVWIAFVPAYVSSPGKYTVAVEIFAILASSYGLLFCIFAPKCYIILLRPERNTKKAIMAK